jgi:hypothetical protein
MTGKTKEEQVGEELCSGVFRKGSGQLVSRIKELTWSSAGDQYGAH